MDNVGTPAHNPTPPTPSRPENINRFADFSRNVSNIFRTHMIVKSKGIYAQYMAKLVIPTTFPYNP